MAAEHVRGAFPLVQTWLEVPQRRSPASGLYTAITASSPRADLDHERRVAAVDDPAHELDVAGEQRQFILGHVSVDVDALAPAAGRPAAGDRVVRLLAERQRLGGREEDTEVPAGGVDHRLALLIDLLGLLELYEDARPLTLVAQADLAQHERGVERRLERAGERRRLGLGQVLEAPPQVQRHRLGLLLLILIVMRSSPWRHCSRKMRAPGSPRAPTANASTASYSANRSLIEVSYEGLRSDSVADEFTVSTTGLTGANAGPTPSTG